MRWTTEPARILAGGLLAGLSGCVLLFNFNGYDRAPDGGSSGSGGSGGSGAGGAAPSSVSSGSGPPDLDAILIGGSSDESVTWMDVDANGNIIIAGVFTGSVDVGGHIEKVLTAATDRGLFVAEFSPSGARLWSRVIATSPPSFQGLFTAGLAVSPFDNTVVIAGGYGGTVDFDTGLKPCVGGSDVFVAKLGQDGKFVWSHIYAGPGDATATAVAVDATGRIVIAGRFNQTLGADEPLNCAALTAGQNDDAFIARLAPDTGLCTWFAQTNSTVNAHADGVAVDKNSNIYMSGAFQGTLKPSALPDLVSTAPQGDIFILNYDSATIPLNATPLAPAGDATITIDPKLDYLLLSGSATGKLYGFANEPYGGGSDALAAKYTFGGTPIIGKLFGSSGSESAQVVPLPGGNGNLVMGGMFQGTLSLGPTTLVSHGGQDAFIAQLDPSGTPTVAARFGDAMNQSIRFVRAPEASPGKIVVAGVFQGTLDFGKGTLVSKGGYDIFVDTLPVPAP